MRSLFVFTTGLVMLAGSMASATPRPLIERQAAIVQQVDDVYYRRAWDAVVARMDEGFRPRARNVIIFVGDGMGISTITAARIYAGQKRGQDGESYKLAMETLPYSALSRTYSHDHQVADSAATATAILSGVKTRSGIVGLRSGTARGNCASRAGQGTDSLFDLAERNRLATGIVSTARITHATPAAAYAESASRDWEDNTAFGDTGDDACLDIARQLVEWSEGDGFEIVMGGGRRHFIPDGMADMEYPDQSGRRSDGRDLLAFWRTKSANHAVITNAAQFAKTDFSTDVRLLGLFEPSHLNFESDRTDDTGGEPSLADLTRAAITRLSGHGKGYILLVEGGRIDHAHHGANAARALEDTDAFDQAVAVARAMTDSDDTLIIVTADHSHTMTIAGYPRRNNPILGKVQYESGAVARGSDGLPYTTLGYANGPGGGCDNVADEADVTGSGCRRADLSGTDTTDRDYRQQGLVHMRSETHAGEDVAIFASGPGASLIRGVMDQNEIFHVVAAATGLVALPAASSQQAAVQGKRAPGQSSQD